MGEYSTKPAGTVSLQLNFCYLLSKGRFFSNLYSKNKKKPLFSFLSPKIGWTMLTKLRIKSFCDIIEEISSLVKNWKQDKSWLKPWLFLWYADFKYIPRTECFSIPLIFWAKLTGGLPKLSFFLSWLVDLSLCKILF